MGPKTGLLGGTFNPLHNGHLLLAQWAREELGLDEVWFVPNCQPPHRYAKPLPRGITPATRWELLVAGLAGLPGFVPSDLELARGGESYTVETLTALRAAHPAREWFLLVGADALAQMHTWHGFPEFLRLCRVVAAHRDGVEPAPAPEVAERTIWLRMPRFEFSSRLVRERAAAGRSLRFLVPAGVERLIRERGLYRPPAGAAPAAPR